MSPWADMVVLHGSIRKAAAAANIPPSTLQGHLRREARAGLVGGPPIPVLGRPPEGFEVKENNATYDADGKLVRQSVRTAREAGEVFKTPEGFLLKEQSVLTDGEGRLKLRWSKLKEEGGNATSLVEALRTTFAQYEGMSPLIPTPVQSDEDLLTIYPLPDLHIGMLSHDNTYGIEEATRVIVGSLSHLVAQSRPSKHAVILGLGDLFHTNDQTNATPAHKHRLDVDGKWPRIFAAGAKIMTAIVDLVAQKHEQVEVVNLPGNHDPDAAVCLTVALSLFYGNNFRIKVYDEPTLTWYRRFGKVLLGATHGHTVKMEKLALMMAADRPVDWGQAVHRSFYTGHIHHEVRLKEDGPVRVESFSTPAARDGFAQNAGHRSGRALNAITIHRQEGETGRHRVNILH